MRKRLTVGIVCIIMLILTTVSVFATNTELLAAKKKIEDLRISSQANNIPAPTHKGKEGEVSTDAYALYRWSDTADFWIWNK